MPASSMARITNTVVRHMSNEQQPFLAGGGFYWRADGVSDTDAMLIAAAKNIGEGTGTAIDAAKVFRLASEDHPTLRDLPPRSVLVRDGRALAKLGPDALGMVVNGMVPPHYAAIVARLIEGDPLLQVEALRLLIRAAPENARQAELIVRELLATGTTRETQANLFGEDAFASSIVVERAQILDTALKQVKRDKAAFAMLVREGKRLAETGNVLADAANRERLDADAQALEVLTRIATRAGPISDALSAAAQAFKSGETGRGEAARRFLEAVRRADLTSLERGPGDGGGVAGDARAPDRPAGAAAGDEVSGGTPESDVDPRQQTFFQPAAERPRIGEGEARYVERPDGRYVALADGSDALGAITPEIAAAIGREAAPIRLPEGDARFGETHIEARHGRDIRKAGYADAADFVAEVANAYTDVYQAKGGRLILARRIGRDRAAIVELRPSEGGTHWSVTTAGLFRPDYLNKETLL